VPALALHQRKDMVLRPVGLPLRAAPAGRARGRVPDGLLGPEVRERRRAVLLLQRVQPARADTDEVVGRVCVRSGLRVTLRRGREDVVLHAECNNPA